MRVGTVGRVVAIIAALTLAALLTFGVYRILGELHKQSCIEEVEARWPAVPIEVKGGLFRRERKVPIAQRRRAVAECEATIF